MSKWKTVAIVVVLLMNFALAGGALFYANLLQKPDLTSDVDLQANLAVVAGYSPDAEAGDVVVPLSAVQRGGNLRIDFAAGKATTFVRDEHEGTWDQLGGAVVYRPASQEFVAIEVEIAVGSLSTDALPLTNTVLSKEKWFDYENHPMANFSCSQITRNTQPSSEVTHFFDGQFTLNGITRDLSIPAKLAFTGQAITLEAAFTILRSDYDVEKRAGSVAGSLGGAVSEVDDEIQMHVRMTASPDISIVIAELAGVIETQSIHLGELQGVIESMENRLRSVEALVGRFGETTQRRVPLRVVEIENLPLAFTDHAPEYAAMPQEDGTTGPGVKRIAPFEMILVPGDESAGIAPFYMSKLEATWAMMEAWCYCREIGDVNEINRLIEAGLRPTPLYGDPNVLVQMGNAANPARAMSRLTAESFCKWLSEKTGRHYRLPTEAEWEHAFIAGGGMPDDLAAASWHFESAPVDEFLGQPDPDLTPEDLKEVPAAGTKAPNALGIHDMLGSVSEWVIPENAAERALRGGNMRTRAADLVFTWREVEEPEGWFAAYPNQPHSLYWYPSYEFGGIRLVCEAWSVAENPPTTAP